MLKSSPTVSVIIPVLRKPLALEVSLKNFLNKDFEVIVVNDGASEEVSEVVNGFKSKIELKEIRYNPPKGPAFARNAGTEIAKGEWLMFIDDGIELDNNWEEMFKRHFNNYDYIASNVKIKPSKKETNLEKIFRIASFPCEDHFFKDGYGVTACLFVKKEVFIRVGGFPNVFAVEDLCLGKRLSDYESSKVFLQELVAWHEPKNLTTYIKDLKKYARGQNEVRRKLLGISRAYLLRKNLISFLKNGLKIPLKMVTYCRSPLYQKSQLSHWYFFWSYLCYLIIQQKIRAYKIFV